MALKSYRFTTKRKEKRMKRGGSRRTKRRLSDTGRLVGTGVTALIGVGLLSETAEAVARI